VLTERPRSSRGRGVFLEPLVNQPVVSSSQLPSLSESIARRAIIAANHNRPPSAVSGRFGVVPPLLLPTTILERGLSGESSSPEIVPPLRNRNIVTLDKI
jgi:hypothetical protein